MKFRLWIEEEQGYIDSLIQQMKDFRSVGGHLYPSQHTDNNSALDLAAVLAGTKPACAIPVQFANTPTGQEMLKRVQANPQFKIQQGFGSFADDSKSDYAVGLKQNVDTIVNAFQQIKLLRRSTQPEDIKKLALLHRVVGLNLGYPHQEVDKFAQDYVRQRIPAQIPAIGR